MGATGQMSLGVMLSRAHETRFWAFSSLALGWAVLPRIG